jgi:copper homeostasis protein
MTGGYPRNSMPRGRGDRHGVLVEICVTSVEDAVVAEAAGADRVEVCSALVEGGITPSAGLVRSVLAVVSKVGVQVLVRPRGGDFVYSRTERAVMRADIEAVLALPRPHGTEVGFVVGALTEDGEVDAGVTAELISACGGAAVTFHRAFDFTVDRRRALALAADLGARRVLTSGGGQRALDSVDALADLVHRAGDSITILAGGGVRADNVHQLVERTGVREVHLRAAHEQPSPVLYRPAGISLNATGPLPEYVRSAISPESVAAVCRALRGPGTVQ